MPLFRGEVTAMHPKFPPGSKAATIEDCEGPLPLVFRGEDGTGGEKGGKGEWERIVYDEKDEEAVDAAVREYGESFSLCMAVESMPLMTRCLLSCSFDDMAFGTFLSKQPHTSNEAL